ncbi:MAG: molybdopterin-guanine dinucleotide biosynthesis protein B [Chloroflexi bacterium]|nr:molybdopterin-guanine dinucleotide biosynthesis protein B [Chloroflexota bacterium]
MTTPVIAIVGNSDSGKTRVAAALVSILSGKGYRVAAVKHCPHGHEVAPQPKDTARLFAAGAHAVVASSPGQITVTRRTEGDALLEAIVASLGGGYDVVIAEGFKGSSAPKVLMVDNEPLSPPPESIIATVRDKPVDGPVPSYTFGQMDALTLYLESRLGLVLR